jgi:GTPase SAR1 family protein
MAFIRLVSAGMGVGKTGFVDSLKNKTFNPKCIHTSIDDNLYLVPFNGNHYNVMELPGGEPDLSLKFNEGDVVILFTPIDKIVEFKLTKQIIKRIHKENHGKNIPIILCGTKKELPMRKVTPEMITELNDQISGYHEISNIQRDSSIETLFADAVSRLR